MYLNPPDAGQNTRVAYTSVAEPLPKVTKNLLGPVVHTIGPKCYLLL
jgi:hypothetical protein